MLHMQPINAIKPKTFPYLLLIAFCIAKIITDQGTQTDCLLITEDEEEPQQRNGNKNPLRKSASFSSSTTASQSPGSSSLGSATSTMSLRSTTPQRANNPNQTGSTRSLRSDTINTFQKWETTVESISYVSTKTVSISDFSKEPQLQQAQAVN